MAPESMEVYLGSNLEFHLENLNLLKPIQDVFDFRRKLGLKS